MAINPAFEPELSYCVESEIAEEKKQFLEKAKAKKIEYGYTLPPIGRILPGLFEFDTFEGMNYHQFTPHQVVGPLYWSGWKQNRKPDRNKYMDAKVILVTIGSSYPFPHIVKCVIDSFGGKKGYWVIINSGGQVGKEYTDYPNVEDAPFIALDDYLAISHAVVFHGGHGTVLRLIKAGVPGVAIPFNGSQMIVSRQFEKLGLGIRIKKYPDDVTVVELHTALMSVLHDPSFRERMAPYRNLLEQRSNGEEEASDFIEQYTHNANLKRLSYALMSLRSGQI
jgi:UDP:flavonoid glycosyltransferase YjiC (YdhE family)